MPVRFLSFFAVAAVLPMHGLQVGPSAREQTLGRGSKETQVRVALDRGEYFPGEEVVATARVANQSSTTVEVPDPADELHLMFYASRYRRERPDQPEQASLPTLNIRQASKSIVIGPREEREYKVTLSDPTCFGRWHPEPRSTQCVDTTIAGRYVLKAVLGSGGRGRIPETRFSVVVPTLYLWDCAILNRFFTIPPEMIKGVPPEMAPTMFPPRRLLVPVAAVEYGGEHFVLVRRKAGYTWKALTTGPFTFLERATPFMPYFRAATLRHRIVSLGATADAAENLTVTFSDASGATHLLRFDNDGNPIREK